MNGLLARVLEFILEIRTDINHPELEKIIESITEAISESQHLEEPRTDFGEELMTDLDEDISMPMKASLPGEFESYEQSERFLGKDFTWAGILKLIG
jgi:hypothetical protein